MPDTQAVQNFCIVAVGYDIAAEEKKEIDAQIATMKQISLGFEKKKVDVVEHDDDGRETATQIER
jgi:hypothetical protein